MTYDICRTQRKVLLGNTCVSVSTVELRILFITQNMQNVKTNNVEEEETDSLRITNNRNRRKYKRNEFKSITKTLFREILSVFDEKDRKIKLSYDNVERSPKLRKKWKQGSVMVKSARTKTNISDCNQADIDLNALEAVGNEVEMFDNGELKK